MKTLFIPPFRNYGVAALAALSLAALPLASRADDDKDKDHKKEHSEKKPEGKPEKRTESRDTHKDKEREAPKKEVTHKEDIHKESTHKEADVHAADKVHHEADVHHDKTVHTDKVVKHDSHVVQHGRTVVHHTDRHAGAHHHSGWVLNYGNGYHGKGYYYGPPHLHFYAESPDIAFFATRGAVPSDYYYDDSTGDETVEMAVQRALNERGYYSGPVDGDIGPGSRRAISVYQGEHQMDPNGQITDDLLASLDID